MTRLYPATDPKYKNAKFVFCNSEITQIPKWATDMLSLLGIAHENIVLVNKPIRFKNLYIPSPAQFDDNNTSKLLARVFQQISKNAPTIHTYDKVYLSRAKMKQRKTFGEEQVQHIFEQNGYKVIYPETIPVAEQVAYVAHCTHLAGVAGTALHMAAFMPPRGTVIALKRNTKPDDNADIQMQINNATGLNFVLIWASIESVPSIHDTNQPQIIGTTQYLRQFWDENTFHYTDRDIAPNQNAWNQYTAALIQYKIQNTKTLSKRLKTILVRLICTIVPGRGRRAHIRHRLKHFFGLKK